MAKPAEQIIPRNIEDEMKASYIDYAMSVIIGRALPDVRDGLKPVHRRILFAMKELGLLHNRPYRKSATVVGDVLGKYHPHGDMAVYDTLVRMVQDFSLRYPLIDGQGNFGCFTKDTKIRLTDGRNLNFEELIKEAGQGKRNYTFTFNPVKQRIEIAEIKNPRLTRKKAKIIKVILDNGQEIKCTPDHLFMIRDGSYKKAKELKPDDSLMPLYTKLYDGRGDPNLKGYEILYQPYQAVRQRHCEERSDEAISVLSMRLPRSLRSLAMTKRVYRTACYEEKRTTGLPKTEVALRYFNNFDDMITQAKRGINHKVIAREIIDRTEDVYDLTIEPWHNFALAAGIFVHNSVDGDPAAAYRYTETRLSSLAEELLKDIDKNTVNFVPTFDGAREEPVVLPTAFPNLMVNGSSGIAVGMATNIPPHNLNEVIDGIIKLIDEPETDINELMKIIKGPDFPTSAIIYGREGIKEAYQTGRGSIQLRAKVDIEDISGGKECLLVRELPYQVNKAALLETIATLIKDKKIEGISDLRDESDREGIRVVIELKRDENAQIILNQLFKHTQLQTSFGIIMLALVDNKPRILNLKELLSNYLKHRQEMVVRRTRFELEKAEARAHILEGLKIAIENLNRVIKIIKESKDVDTARNALMKNFALTQIQAQAILDMRLQQLTGLEREKLDNEYLELIKTIEKLKAILADPKKILNLIKEELLDIKDRYGDERRTKIVAKGVELDIEDLIQEEDVVVTISHAGYVKRLPASTYHAQHRGGKGITGVTTREDDFVEDVFITSTHNYMLLFSNIGRIYWIKVYEIPEGGRTAKGKAIVNLVKLSAANETVTAAITIQDFNKPNAYLLMLTRQGTIKKTPLSEYSNPRQGGIIAINLEETDELMSVKMTDGAQEIIIGTKNGIAIHFKENEVRPIGRVGKGVRGIDLRSGDSVVGMEVVKKDEVILVTTENGYGKKTKISQYRLQSRGGKGVINIKTNQRNGKVICIKRVTAQDDIMLITQKGIIIRQPVRDISTMGRNTQGVRLIRLDPEDKLVSIARIAKENEDIKEGEPKG